MLMRVRDEELYLATHDSFVEFVWALKMTESSASKLINIYQLFVIKRGATEEELLEAGGWTTLYKIKDFDDYKKWIEKAKVLSPKDLDIEIKEAKTGIVQAECEHEFIDFHYCTKCHAKEKIYPDED